MKLLILILTAQLVVGESLKGFSMYSPPCKCVAICMYCRHTSVYNHLPYYISIDNVMILRLRKAVVTTHRFFYEITDYF